MNIILDGSDAVVGYRAIRRYVINLINEFASNYQQSQFKIFLNYFRGNSEVIDRKIKNNKNFSKIRICVPRHISIPLWERLKYPAIDIFTGKADIFHALGDDCPPVKYASYIMTLHGIVYMLRSDLIDPTYVKKKQRWLRKMARRADYFVSVSENTKKEFLGFFSFIEPERVKVIPLGIGSEFRIIEKNKVKQALAQRFNINRPYILYVGGIDPGKNIKGIIHGFSIFSEKLKDVDLVLTGYEKGISMDIDNLLLNMKLKKRVKIIDFVGQENDELPILYNGAECFIFPSFCEGWTSPPLEAMACGIPVVTSNVSSLPETVGNAALMVNPEDYEEIGHAVERVLSDNELRRSLIKRGLLRSAKFTWKRCAEETYNFYRYILRNN